MQDLLCKPKTEGLRLSSLVSFFEKDGIIAAYHSMNHQVAFCDAGRWKEIKKKLKAGEQFDEKEKPQIDAMKEKGLIIPVNYNEDKRTNNVKEKVFSGPSFGLMYLILAEMCNIRCKYCFIENAIPEGRQLSMMTKETAIKAIELFAKSLQRNPTNHIKPAILMYGGEPLLNKETFVVAAEEITRLKRVGRLPPGTRTTIITNGTLVDEDIVETIKSNDIQASVSIDGWKEIQDANRIYKDGRGTFDKTYRAIKRLKEAGINVSISCTVTEQNIDRLEEVLFWLADEFGIKGLGFNTLLDFPGVSQADEAYIKKATDQLIKCFIVAREKGIYEDRIMRKVKTFVDKTLRVNDCGACGNQMVVNPAGKIGPCQGFLGTGEYFTGDVNNPEYDPFTDSTFIEWSERSPLNLAECQKCNTIGICGGGCAYNAYLKTGSIWRIDKKFCIHTKTSLEWIIWDLWAHLCESRSNLLIED